MVEPESGAEAADAAGDAAEVLDRPLPEGVRRRVVALVSDAFGGLTVAGPPAAPGPLARVSPTPRGPLWGTRRERA
ncbi:RNA-binding protein, partial [Streptomyces sp. NPDC059411]